MLKSVLSVALLVTPALAGAVPAALTPHRSTALFTAVELNNLSRLDETSRPVRVRRMESEIALLRDQLGRMKLDRLIETVLTDSTARR